MLLCILLRIESKNSFTFCIREDKKHTIRYFLYSNSYFYALTWIKWSFMVEHIENNIADVLLNEMWNSNMYILTKISLWKFQPIPFAFLPENTIYVLTSERFDVFVKSFKCLTIYLETNFIVNTHVPFNQVD